MEVLTDLNLQKNQIINTIIHKVESDPAKEAKNIGMIIYNSIENKLKYYNGIEWVVIGSGSGQTITIDVVIDDSSTNANAAGSKAVVDYVKNVIKDFNSIANQIKNVNNGQVLRTNPSSGSIEGIKIDSEVKQNSGNLVTSDAVYKAISEMGSLNRKIETSPTLISSAGTAVWTIELEHTTKATVQVFESNTNEMILASIKDTPTSIEITFKGVDGTTSANTFYAVIIY